MTDNAVAYIQTELKSEAARYFYDKYNALDTDISADGFTYTGGGKTIVHPHKAITTAYIKKTLHNEMVSVAMSSIPLVLLERTGSTQSVLRVVDRHWYVRLPSAPIDGEALDIDEGLAQVVLYRAMYSLGITKYMQTAKEMIEAYSKAVTMPDPFAYDPAVGFRFGPDGVEWHDNYAPGDAFMAISKDGVWGNPIPIICGTAGASSFAELSDVQTPMVAGKLLAVNGTGDGIEYVDPPAASGTTGGGMATTIRADYQISTTTAVLDASGDARLLAIDVLSNTEINFTEVDYVPALAENQRYTMFIAPNGYTVTFSNSLIVHGLNAITPTALYVIIEFIYINSQLFVVSQKDY